MVKSTHDLSLKHKLPTLYKSHQPEHPNAKNLTQKPGVVNQESEELHIRIGEIREGLSKIKKIKHQVKMT